MFKFLLIKYPIQYTIISCSIATILTLLGLIVYSYYIFRQKKSISALILKTFPSNNEEEIVEKKIIADLNENVKKIKEESISIKTTKTNKNIDSKYLNLNLNNPTFTNYLHKSNKPFIGY
jgi:hypothetical protein